MNFHPILVHIPVALLSFYAVFECIRIDALLKLREWFYIKASFLFLGGLGALAAALAGPLGERLFSFERSTIQAHKFFAGFTIAIFGLIALIYLAMFIDDIWGKRIWHSRYRSAWRSIMEFDDRLFTGAVLVPMAVAGLAALLVTAALGVTIVYGATNDPFTHAVNTVIAPLLPFVSRW